MFRECSALACPAGCNVTRSGYARTNQQNIPGFPARRKLRHLQRDGKCRPGIIERTRYLMGHRRVFSFFLFCVCNEPSYLGNSGHILACLTRPLLISSVHSLTLSVAPSPLLLSIFPPACLLCNCFSPLSSTFSPRLSQQWLILLSAAMIYNLNVRN